MEFRKCPACQASVLEDDAAECPFCGASMSGKPAAAPSKAAPAKSPSRKPTEKPAAKTPTKPPSGEVAKKPAAGKQLATRAAVAEKPAAADDDPFDVDTSAVAQAPPVARRPAKGRMIRIVCPMCETPGFISPKMRGRDVKCCNPDCLVPVFKAPLPEKKAAPEEDTGRGVSTAMLWGGLAAGVALVAGLTYFFLIVRAPPEEYDPSKHPIANSTTSKQDATAEANPNGDGDEAVAAVPVRISLEEIQRRALELSVIAARQRDGNRSKPYCRRMAAESYAQVGNLKEAEFQIKRLKAVTSEPFYRVEPLVEIAWQQMAKRDQAAAQQTVEEAFQSAVDLPSYGRAAVTAVSSAGAALAATDRMDDARAVIQRLNRDDDATLSRERVAALVQIANDLKMFDLDQLLKFSSLDMAAEPVAISVATGVASQGDWKRAIAWSLAADDIVKQEDRMAAVAVVAGWKSARSGDDAPVSAVTDAAKQLPAAGQSRVAAGVATGYLLQNDREAATAALEQAIALLSEVDRPPVFPKPNVKLIHDADERDHGLPADAARLRSAAIGTAQVARLQVLLGDEAAAWTTFLKVWEFTQGMAPEWETTSRLVDEIDNNKQRAEQRVQRDLDISNRDLATRAFNKYRRTGRIWREAADERFQLEVSLLKDAIRWELLDDVAALLADPSAVIPSAGGQPYRSTTLVSILAEAYTAVGNDAKSREVTALASDANVTRDRIAPLIAETERLFRAKKYTEAAQALGKFQARHDVEQRRDLRAMQLACRMVKLRSPNLYFPFILALNEPVLTEDSLELTAALAVHEGMAADLWERHQAQHLSATQRVAFYRGLIAGIVAANASSPSTGTKTAAKPAQASSKRKE